MTHSVMALPTDSISLKTPRPEESKPYILWAVFASLFLLLIIISSCVNFMWNPQRAIEKKVLDQSTRKSSKHSTKMKSTSKKQRSTKQQQTTAARIGHELSNKKSNKKSSKAR